MIHEVDEELAESQMSFGDHLEELRSRLVRAILSTVASFILIFTFLNREVMRFVVAPFSTVTADLRMDDALKMLGPTQGFFAYLKVSLIASLLVSAPFWMWQFWQFVAAGLYRHERLWVYRFAPLMIGLFVTGVSFGYAVLIPVGLRYLLSFPDPEVVQSWIGLTEYLSLFTTLTLVLGLTFQLPVGMALFAKLDLVGVTTFREKRRFFVLAAFILGALLTPPDVVTQSLMAAPLILLFELGIFLAWLAEGERRGAVNWAMWRRRGLIAAVIVVVLFLFQDKLRESYRARLVTRGVRTPDRVVEETVPYMEIFTDLDALSYAPDAPPATAYRVSGDDEQELWIVGGEQRADPVRIRFEDPRLSKVSDAGGVARFSLRAGSQILDVRVLRETGPDTMQLLLDALENASSDDRPLVEVLAAGLAGERPEGTRRIEDGEDGGDVVAAWQRWWDAQRGAWRFKRDG